MRTELRAHHIQFYEYQPSNYTCLAASNSFLLAAGREDGCLDVYDAKRNFFLISHISGSILKSVEAVCWLGDRLFCTGALGRLCEVDITTCSLKDSCLLIGNPVSRCLAVDEDKIYVGNDEGYIVLFQALPSLEMKHTLPKLSGKVLALAFTSKLNMVAASTSSGILVLIATVNDSPLIHRTLLSESATQIWSLLFCKNVLFSGDSKGCVCVWDVHVGGLLTTFHSHVAFVLTLACSPDEHTVFSGGSDAVIHRYDFCFAEGDQNHWELGNTIRGCRRDVRGLAYISGQHYDPASVQSNLDSRFEPHRLVAVGLDARLLVLACEQPERGLDAFAKAHQNLAYHVGRIRDSSVGEISYVAALPFWPLGCAPTRPKPIYFPPLRDRSGTPPVLCILRYPDRLLVTRLAKPVIKRSKKQFYPTEAPQLYPMSKGAVHLAEIRPRRGMEMITSCLSSCGHFLAYSDMVRTRILQINISTKPDCHIPSVTVSRVCWTTSATTTPRKRSRAKRHRSSSRSPRISNSSLQSSSETDTDNDELSIAKFFDLDPLPNDSISQSQLNETWNTIPDSPIPQSNQLPSSSCVCFSPDSEAIVTIDRVRNVMSCTSLQSGVECWQVDLDLGSPFRVHELSISDKRTIIGYVIILLCSDGRVRLYTLTSGSHLVTCPSLPSVSGTCPLPVSVSCWLRSDNEFDVSVIYTNSQLSEWHFAITSDLPADVLADACPDSAVNIRVQLNMWLRKFWDEMEHEVSSILGVFHSVSYVNERTWLLASDRYLVMLFREKEFGRGMVRRVLKPNSKTKPEWCMKICKQFESIIQATALSSNEIAIVSLHSAGIALRLSAPMQRKQFGT